MVLDLVSAMVPELVMAKGLAMEKVTALAKERVTELVWAPRHPA